MRNFKSDLLNVLKISPFIIILLLGFMYFFGTPCLISGTTGYPCPGCGLTRAFYYLLSGNFKESLRYHALLIPVLLYLLYSGLSLYKLKKSNNKYFIIITIIFLLVILSYYAYRLIYNFPNTSPMTINDKAILQRIFNK